MGSIQWPEICVLLLLPLLIVAVPIFSAVWVYRDASSKGSPSATIWCIGTVLVWFPVFVLYLLIRANIYGDHK